MIYCNTLRKILGLKEQCFETPSLWHCLLSHRLGTMRTQDISDLTGREQLYPGGEKMRHGAW